jgi:hypothetical protein
VSWKSRHGPAVAITRRRHVNPSNTYDSHAAHQEAVRTSASNIVFPVTILNESTRHIMSTGRVVLRNFADDDEYAYVLFGRIPPGQQDTQNGMWPLKLDPSGQPIYPTSFLYVLSADDGGGWSDFVDAGGSFVSLRIHVHDSDWHKS